MNCQYNGALACNCVMNCKYNNALDKYAKKLKLTITTDVIQNKSLGVLCYSTTVEYKDKVIVDKLERKKYDDDELLRIIKRQINLLELGI